MLHRPTIIVIIILASIVLGKTPPSFFPSTPLHILAMAISREKILRLKKRIKWDKHGAVLVRSVFFLRDLLRYFIQLNCYCCICLVHIIISADSQTKRQKLCHIALCLLSLLHIFRTVQFIQFNTCKSSIYLRHLPFSY